jgi:hypothetical protein
MTGGQISPYKDNTNTIQRAYLNSRIFSHFVEQTMEVESIHLSCLRNDIKRLIREEFDISTLNFHSHTASQRGSWLFTFISIPVRVQQTQSLLHI